MAEVENVPACWSCLALIESGDTVCPLCGADQTKKEQNLNQNSAPKTLPEILREWAMVLLVLAAGIAGMVLILMYNFSARRLTPAEQNAEIAANSLRNVREALSYAALSGNAYPIRLDSLGARVAQPLEHALTAGYRLQYSHRVLPGGGDGFVIQAIPEKADHLNLYIDETGIVRATAESHAASAQDAPWWR